MRSAGVSSPPARARLPVLLLLLFPLLEMVGNAVVLVANGDCIVADVSSRSCVPLCAKAEDVITLNMHAETMTCVKIDLAFRVGFFMLVFYKKNDCFSVVADATINMFFAR